MGDVISGADVAPRIKNRPLVGREQILEDDVERLTTRTFIDRYELSATVLATMILN